MQDEFAETELPVGLILAGGKSCRFGGTHKALAELDGRPLIAHVIARLSPCVRRLVIACGPHAPVLGHLGLPMLDDGGFSGRGPLAGIHAGLQALDADEAWLASVPCDMPFVDGHRVRALMDARKGTRPVAETAEDGMHDGVVLWHTSHRVVLAATLSGDCDHSVRRVLSRLNGVCVRAEAEAMNVNTPGDLARAQRLLGT